MDEFLFRWSAYLHIAETQFVCTVVVITILMASLFRFFGSLMDEGTSSKGHVKLEARRRLPGGGPSVGGGGID